MIMAIAILGSAFVGLGLATNWFDGLAEDNDDRNNQREIFCQGLCDYGDNIRLKPCTHPDVASPKNYLVHGTEVCEDGKWKGPLIDLTAVLNRIPGIGDDDEEDVAAR